MIIGQESKSICLVCDFFYPNIGGVETHIWSLAQCLIDAGHKVIVITHNYDKNNRNGIRIMTNGLKVYYVPLVILFDQIKVPSLFSFFILFRNILIRENVSIIHGHQSTSPLTHECLLYARILGCKTCFTDHSLFGFSDTFSIHTNKILEMTLSDIDQVICVSDACTENLIVRASIHHKNVTTIPNAVDCTRFIPNLNQKQPLKENTTSKFTIIMMNRLVYRKGINLVIEIVPIICKEFVQVHFMIGGDGPERRALEEMCSLHNLESQVSLLGAVPHDEVRNVLVKGDLFLNCSLTESFCVAILEAASCGLPILSTNVGGIPEILPESMLNLVEPTSMELIKALQNIILNKNGSEKSNLTAMERHLKVKSLYNWHTIAKKTEIVYEKALRKDGNNIPTQLLKRLSAGMVVGPILCMIVLLLHGYRIILEIFLPASNIESAIWIRKQRHQLVAESEKIKQLRMCK